MVSPMVSPVFPVSTPLEINLLMLENSSLLCPLQLRWHFILIQDPKWMVAVCALAGRQWCGGARLAQNIFPTCHNLPSLYR